ncbi:MAG: HDIG domain-containing protein [Armatimonadetes bacterium]|nr:HDIG domain-containing protein [Armatimonadota bacterium]
MLSQSSLLTRGEAFALLLEYTKSDALIKHALAVEGTMRHMARHYGEDEELWAITGLLHDFDYEIHPDMERHPIGGARILREKEIPEEVIQAILGHSTHTGVPRETIMARTLFSVDELAGFVVAVALVRPNKRLDEVQVSSVKKKLKDKAFARNVSREDIRLGAEELGMDLDTLIGHVLEALRPMAASLGL